MNKTPTRTGMSVSESTLFSPHTPRAIKSIGTESRRMVTRGWGGDGELLFNGYKFQFLKMKIVLELGCTKM